MARAKPKCVGPNCQGKNPKHIDYDHLSAWEAVTIAVVAFLAVTYGVVQATVLMG